MSSAVAPAPVLADRIPKSAVREVALVLGLVALTALAAQVRIPLPFTPAPITGQTFAVLLGAAALGPLRASTAQVLYIGVGVAGMPVFSGFDSGWEVMTGATGGYIVGFVVASVVVGAMARRRMDRSPVGMAAAFVVGSLVIYAFGVPWMAATTPFSLTEALWLGAGVFVVGDVIKAVLAGGLLPSAWRLAER
jgi:biotin transport system substrate-specific component